MSSEHDDASEPLLSASNTGGTSNAGATRTTAADTGTLCNDDTTHIERNALGIREAVHYAPSNSRQRSDSPCLLCCDLLIVLVIGGLLGVAGLLLIEVADASGPPGEMAGSVLVCGLAVFGLAGAALMPRDVNIAKAKPLLSGSSRANTFRNIINTFSVATGALACAGLSWWTFSSVSSTHHPLRSTAFYFSLPLPEVALRTIHAFVRPAKSNSCQSKVKWSFVLVITSGVFCVYIWLRTRSLGGIFHSDVAGAPSDLLLDLCAFLSLRLGHVLTLLRQIVTPKVKVTAKHKDELSFMQFWRVYSDVTHRRLHRQLEAVGFSLTAVASAAVVVAFWSPPHELETWLAAGGNAHLSASRYFYMYKVFAYTGALIVLGPLVSVAMDRLLSFNLRRQFTQINIIQMTSMVCLLALAKGWPELQLSSWSMSDLVVAAGAAVALQMSTLFAFPGGAQLPSLWAHFTTTGDMAVPSMSSLGLAIDPLSAPLIYRDEKLPAASPQLAKTIIFVLVTIYHESVLEMRRSIESLLSLAQWPCEADNEGKVPTLYPHVCIDNAWAMCGTTRTPTLSPFAAQYLAEFARLAHMDVDVLLKAMETTSFGSEIKIPINDGPVHLEVTIVLKYTAFVRQGKRASQNLLLHKVPKLKASCGADDAVILSVDGDTVYTAANAHVLVRRLLHDSTVAGVCGRVRPIVEAASFFILPFQMFDYAISFWIGKPVEAVFGSVVCLPGAFCALRYSRIRSILSLYADQPKTGLELSMMSLGEDRWLCYMLIKLGHQLRYTPAAEALTFAPSTFWELVMQRRRWLVSTVVVTRAMLEACSSLRKAGHASFVFVGVQALQLGSFYIAPAFIILAITFSTMQLCDLSMMLSLMFASMGCVSILLTDWWSTLEIRGSWSAYSDSEIDSLKDASKPYPQAAGGAHSAAVRFDRQAVAKRVRDSVGARTQRIIVTEMLVFSGIHGISMFAVLWNAIADYREFNSFYVFALAATVVICALLHLDATVLLGPFYLIGLPYTLMYQLLFSAIYAGDLSWGTRLDGPAPKSPAIDYIVRHARLQCGFDQCRLKEAVQFVAAAPLQVLHPPSGWCRLQCSADITTALDNFTFEVSGNMTECMQLLGEEACELQLAFERFNRMSKLLATARAFFVCVSPSGSHYDTIADRLEELVKALWEKMHSLGHRPGADWKHTWAGKSLFDMDTKCNAQSSYWDSPVGSSQANPNNGTTHGERQDTAKLPRVWAQETIADTLAKYWDLVCEARTIVKRRAQAGGGEAWHFSQVDQARGAIVETVRPHLDLKDKCSAASCIAAARAGALHGRDLAEELIASRNPRAEDLDEMHSIAEKQALAASMHAALEKASPNAADNVATAIAGAVVRTWATAPHRHGTTVEPSSCDRPEFVDLSDSRVPRWWTPGWVAAGIGMAVALATSVILTIALNSGHVVQTGVAAVQPVTNTTHAHTTHVEYHVVYNLHFVTAMLYAAVMGVASTFLASEWMIHSRRQDQRHRRLRTRCRQFEVQIGDAGAGVGVGMGVGVGVGVGAGAGAGAGGATGEEGAAESCLVCAQQAGRGSACAVVVGAWQADSVQGITMYSEHDVEAQHARAKREAGANELRRLVSINVLTMAAILIMILVMPFTIAGTETSIPTLATMAVFGFTLLLASMSAAYVIMEALLLRFAAVPSKPHRSEVRRLLAAMRANMPRRRFAAPHNHKD